MRTFTFKGLFLTAVFMLLGCLSIQAQGFIYNPDKGNHMIIYLGEAGTLPDRIDRNEMYNISYLKIIGEINGTDLSMIHQIAQSKNGILSVLDLSEARIVKGGQYIIGPNSYSTSKDKIPYNLFCGCKSLTNVTLPPLVSEIGVGAFRGCI